MIKKSLFVTILLLLVFACNTMQNKIKNNIDNDLLKRFSFIKRGEFIMGRGFDCKSIEAFGDPCPTQNIYLDDYYISKYEVTNEEYVAFLNDVDENEINGKIITDQDMQSFRDKTKPIEELSKVLIRITSSEEMKNRFFGYQYTFYPAEIYFQNGRYLVRHGFEKRPVHTVSYLGAQAYCDWLSKKIDLEVRLPSEAQWEKAAWGGTTDTIYPWGNEFTGKEANVFNKQEMNFKNSVSTTDVGSFPPNGYDVYDMVGNVSEICRDVFDFEPRKREYINPVKTSNAKDVHKHVTKGGCFIGLSNTVIYGRAPLSDYMAFSYIGFRIVIEN